MENSIVKLDHEYIAQTYSRFPIALSYGKGSKVYSDTGKEYIDFGSGIAVNSFGIGDEVWKKAVIDQLDKIQHTSNLYYSEPCTKLAALLCEKTGLKKVFFQNSGAEANECAIKTARKYAHDRYGEKRKYIVCLKNSFHGRTVTTLSATGQDVFHKDFGPFTDGFIFIEPNDIKEVKDVFKRDDIAAVMLEIVQGEGGINVLNQEYVAEINHIAKQKDIVIIIDEVQTGNGRTGTLYAYMQYDIEPDIVTTAKGLGGGLPIGAAMFGEKTENVLSYGSHGSTFGGNPVCCAGAISIISRIDESFLKSVKEKSEYIFSRLNGAKGIKSVSGLGLMIGIETEKETKEVINKCIENGLLVLSAKNKIRLLPPLNIDYEDLQKGIDIIKGACEQ